MKRKRSIFALILGLGLPLVLLWLLAGTLSTHAAPAATTRYVDDAGSDTSDCSDALTPCQTVQYTVDQADAGDKIYVAGAGVHWPDVDEDISAAGMLHGVPARRPNRATATPAYPVPIPA